LVHGVLLLSLFLVFGGDDFDYWHTKIMVAFTRVT
jgi:hypothetical protein